MNNNNALIYCCRSEKHIGSLHRAIALAAELGESLDVTILLDENTPMLVDVPESTKLVYLPPLRVDPDSNVFHKVMEYAPAPGEAGILTLGLFLLVINALIIMMAGGLVSGFSVDGFWWALLFSLLLSLVQSILFAFLKEEA